MKKYIVLPLLALALIVASLFWPTNVQRLAAQNWNAYPWVKQIPNDTSTGTTQFKTACLSSGKAVVCGTGATAGFLGICVQNCTTTGSALIAFAGLVPLVVDGTTTVDHYVWNSPTVAGDGHDSAATSFPTANIVIGKVQTASTGAASVSLIDMNTEIQGVSPSGSGMADPGANGVMTRTSNNISAQAGATAMSAPVLCTTTGSANAFVCAPSPAVASYVSGTLIRMISNFANTGAATIDVSGLGAKSITKNGITAAALAPGDIGNGQAVDLVYDGTQFEMQSPLANALLALFATNAQTGTYQVLAADFANYKTIPVASGTFTITLVASGSQPASGQSIGIINYGSGVVTVARSGQNINGAAANLTIPAGSSSAPTGMQIWSDGTNYIAQTWGGSSAATAINPLGWAIWGNSYSSADSLPISTTLRGHSQGFTVFAPITSSKVKFHIGTTASGTCGGTCGAQIAIYAEATLTSPVCLSTVGTSGNATASLNINATGIKAFTWASGSGVSGSICTLQPGAYLLMYSSDSALTKIANYGDTRGFSQISGDADGVTTFNYRFGESSSAIATGSGASVGITTDLSSIAWVSASAALQFSLTR
jgi:hypothetical protein